VYRQAQKVEDLSQKERAKKTVIEVYGEEKQMSELKATPNKKYR